MGSISDSLVGGLCFSDLTKITHTRLRVKPNNARSVDNLSAMADIAESFDAGGWKFTPEVTDEFDEHVSASVPHYLVIQQLVAQASDWPVPHGGHYVDLGASTGTTAEQIAKRHPDRRIRATLIDEVPEMLDRAVRKLDPYPNMVVARNPQNICAPLTYAPSDLVTALFTLQFLAPDQRESVLANSRARSKASGAIVLAEKVRPSSSVWHEIATDLSHDFKESAGLSDTAIRQKARSLRGVLRPVAMDSIVSELTGAGWNSVEVLFRWHQWVVVGALAAK